MQIRVVSSGIVSGVFCLAALWFPWYMMEPAGIVPEWVFVAEAELFPDWLPVGVYLFCALTVFAFGWVAARWNWSKTWRSSLLAGAGSGLIAGCIVYDILGAFRFGLLGQAEMLKSYYFETGVDNGLSLVFTSVFLTETLIYLNFILTLFAGSLVGALGGVVSAVDLDDVWGKPPHEPPPWLFKFPGYSLTLSGVGLMTFVISFFGVFQEILATSVIENNLTGFETMPSLVFHVGYFACYAVILPPTGLTWGWIFRDWREGGSLRPFYGIWLATSLVGLGWALSEFIQNDSAGLTPASLGSYPLNIFIVAVLGSLVLGFLGGYYSEIPASTSGRSTVYDWLGYSLTQGILGGTQGFIVIPAFSLVLMMVPAEYLQYLMQAGFTGLSPAEQVVQLFRLMSGISIGLFFISIVVGWIFAAIVLVFRRLLRIKPAGMMDQAGS